MIPTRKYDLGQFEVIVSTDGTVRVESGKREADYIHKTFEKILEFDNGHMHLNLLEVKLAFPTNLDKNANPKLFKSHTGLCFDYKNSNHTITSDALKTA